MIILLDQDGPLADFEEGFLKNWRTRFPKEVAVEVEQRTQFEISSDYPERLRDQVVSIYHTPDFFLSLKVVDGAVEAVRKIQELRHELFICTSPLSAFEHCVSEKYLWVEKYFGRDLTRRIILTKDKTLVRGDILIDDKPEITGLVIPSWEHVLFNAPYNRAVSNGRKIITWNNWREILKI